MRTTKLPGMKAQHMIVSDNCRSAHGGLLEALDEAYRRMRETVERQYAKAWPSDRGDEFHLVLTADLASQRREGDKE